MKSTGVVRRIDELGRIVVPKEIRKNLKMQEGENIEIYIDDDKIILKKHSLIKEYERFLKKLSETLNLTLKSDVIITDREKVIIANGKIKKEVLNEQLSEELLMSIKRRENVNENYKKQLIITENKSFDCFYVLKSITVQSDTIGLLIIISNEKKLTDCDEKIIDVCKNFIEKYLEE